MKLDSTHSTFKGQAIQSLLVYMQICEECIVWICVIEHLSLICIYIRWFSTL